MIDQARRCLGNYRLLYVLGKGSFADVYLGKHLHLKTEAAIKVLYGRMDEETIEKFLTEASHLRELEHPNIVRILDVGIEKGTPYLVMEYAPFGTLRTRHPQGERLPLPIVVSYVQQIACALDYAHDHQLIHRDLKPENLLLGNNDHILLSDFGVALPLRHTDSMSVQTIGGTLAYMAPEQIRGKPRAASDQYALAIMVYEWLSGSRPFSGDVAELLGQHLFVQPPALREQVPDLPPSVELIINKALSKDARARFDRAGEFADLLERASRGEELLVSHEVSGSPANTGVTPSPSLEPARKIFYNLPAQVTTLIGRDTELKAATVLLSQPEIRLLTLTGPGGIGKTRLALACVAKVLSAFRDGTCFVGLASITHPDQVIPTLIQTLGITEQRDLTPITSLKQVLHDKHLLLVLDNFEQVVDAAPLLLELLQGCPELKMLVTSRSLLHMPGEHTFPLPPLAIPASKQASAENASVALFVERARAVKPDFQILPANASALAELCRKLEGLPLAIELAAVRSNMLSPAQLLARLSRRLDLLGKPGSAAPRRQQTIRQTIHWSYDLLTPQEKQLFCRLSIFVGGCQLADIEALYSQLGEDHLWVMDGVASLVDKSLVYQKTQERAELRLDLLETLREFGQENLLAEGSLERVRAAHAQHYASLAPVPEPAQLGLAEGELLARLKREYQNLLAALRFFLEKQHCEQALQLATGMGGIWFLNGYGSEGQEEMERTLAIVQTDQTQIPPSLHTMALTLTGRISIGNTDFIQATHWYRQSLELDRTLPDKRFQALTIAGLAFTEGELGNYSEVDALCAESFPRLRQIGDQGVLARMLNVSSMIWLRRGQLDRARSDAQEGVQIAREIFGQQWTLASMLHVLGWVHYLEGDFSTAHAFDQESVALFRKLGFATFGLESLCLLAFETVALGDLETAQTLFEELLTLAREAGNTAEIGRASCGMGYLALERGDWARARIWFEDSLRTLHQIKQLTTRYTYILASSLEGLAVIAWVSKEPVRAAWLLGAADTQRHTGTYIDPRGKESPLWEKTREAVLKTLGTAEFTRTFTEGSRMTPTQALATQEPEQNANEPFSAENSEQPEGDNAPVPAETQPSSHEGSLPSGEHLTRREVEVLRLLAQGLSNAEIAEQLVLSVVTVNSYLRSVYSKLGVSSRTRAARYALDHHLI